MATLSSNEEWVSVGNAEEYVEVTMNDIEMDRLEECINGEESISYLKSLLHRERQDRTRLMTNQMNKNNALEKQLSAANKQNIELRQELKFMRSKLKHQQNNYNNNARKSDDGNVVSKLWNAFKQKNVANDPGLSQKLQQMEHNIHSVQSLQESLDLSDAQNNKIHECMRNLQLSFEDLSKSIIIK